MLVRMAWWLTKGQNPETDSTVRIRLFVWMLLGQIPRDGGSLWSQASQVCSNDVAAHLPCKRGWAFRRGLSHSCRPQEREPCPLTCEWVLRELELWASVTSILFFCLAGCWLSKPMWYTFELITLRFEGSVLVLCYQSVLPECYQMVYWKCTFPLLVEMYLSTFGVWPFEAKHTH